MEKGYKRLQNFSTKATLETTNDINKANNVTITLA